MKIKYETIALEKKTKHELKVFAVTNGLTFSEAVNLLLKQYNSPDRKS